MTAKLYRGDALAVLRDLPDASGVPVPPATARDARAPTPSSPATPATSAGTSTELTEHYYRVAEDRIRSTERGYRPPPAQMVLGAEEEAS